MILLPSILKENTADGRKSNTIHTNFAPIFQLLLQFYGLLQLIICPGLSDLSRIRGFTYTRGIIYAKGINLPSAPTGCNYCGSCLNPRICSCAKLNGSDFPYVHKYGGRRVQCCIRLLEILIEPKAGVFECGLNCGCGPAYVNRTFQKGLRYRLEVFRTPNKGWGVRLWDYIPYVATICEYIGLLKKTDQIDPAADKNYVFDIDCLQTMKGLDGREASILLFYRPNFHFLFSYVIYRSSRFSRRPPPKLLFSPGLDIRSSCVQIIQLLHSLIVLAVAVFPEIRHHDNSAILPFGLWILCFVFLSTLFSFVVLQRRLGEVSLLGN
ncbi:histone-lysine N-methyltransferase SETDB1-like isoform X1 [Capsicum annuum]|uniref:histone-lysine N-methyltransferase SETDB1-like isoform X1 n=1 Tax=Capsicum annuum TaxID=4072 RepID=UPI001FB06F1E|nr:histone-lysine N-methyltransferase SETDB1-like isoform X1 [Capsicum annuum]